MVIENDISQHSSGEFGLEPFTLYYNDEPLDSGSENSQFMLTRSSALLTTVSLLLITLIII